MGKKTFKNLILQNRGCLMAESLHILLGTSACLQWLCHSGERTVARGPLVSSIPLFFSTSLGDCFDMIEKLLTGSLKQMHFSFGHICVKKKGGWLASPAVKSPLKYSKYYIHEEQVTSLVLMNNLMNVFKTLIWRYSGNICIFTYWAAMLIHFHGPWGYRTFFMLS